MIFFNNYQELDLLVVHSLILHTFYLIHEQILRNSLFFTKGRSQQLYKQIYYRIIKCASKYKVYISRNKTYLELVK